MLLEKGWPCKFVYLIIKGEVTEWITKDLCDEDHNQF